MAEVEPTKRRSLRRSPLTPAGLLCRQLRTQSFVMHPFHQGTTAQQIQPELDRIALPLSPVHQ